MFTLSGKFWRFRSDRAARVLKFDCYLIALLANEFPQPEPRELPTKRLLGVAILDRRKPPANGKPLSAKHDIRVSLWVSVDPSDSTDKKREVDMQDRVEAIPAPRFWRGW